MTINNENNQQQPTPNPSPGTEPQKRTITIAPSIPNRDFVLTKGEADKILKKYGR
jgi:hypothetical protein